MNEDIEIPPMTDGTVIERINKADLEPLFDANHDHVYTRGDEETEDYYDEMCTVKGCAMGRLVAKH